MHTLRSPKSTYIAAFLLGGLVALLLAWPARAAELFQLDRVAVVQFTDAGDGKLLRRPGVLHVGGTLQLRPGTTIDRPANTPAQALARPLIAVAAWQAYYGLGFGALHGFMLQEGSVTIMIGDEAFKAIAPDPEAALYDGKTVNVSTRVRLYYGLDQVIAGFVITERPRAVLVRAIGPSLAQFGVSSPAPDPYLVLRRHGEEIASNDNWSEQPDASLVARAAARAGAFPLPPGSMDAARVVLLAPGVYTLHGSPAAPSLTPGEVLVEVYTLPADALFDDGAGGNG